MSNIAKIFIVINFVLSVAYMVVAGTLLAQKWDYRQAFIDLEQKHREQTEKADEGVKDSDARISQLKEQLKNRNELEINLLVEVAELKRDKANLEQKNLSFEQQIKNLDTTMQNIQTITKAGSEGIAELVKKIESETAKSNDLRIQKENAVAEKTELEVQLSNLQGQNAETEKILQTTQKELIEAKNLIRAIKDSGVNPGNLGKGEKPLNGFITAISGTGLPIVMISLGLDDKVEKGYQFTVYRGSEYVGRITVDDVYKDAAACRINKDMTVKQIQKGDNVTTRIGGTRGS